MPSPAIRMTANTEAYKLGAAMLFLAVGVILTALAFEYIGNYIPCPLCLQQRYAYYAGIPLLFGALILLSAEERHWASLIFLAVSLFFLANAGLGVYQAGAEWKLWQGPSTCAVAQPISTSAGDLFKNLPATNVVRCDQAPWHFLGLSFAGWNVVFSLAMFAGCLRAALSSAPENR
jgi:disulfide bond formation protein DsbB